MAKNEFVRRVAQSVPEFVKVIDCLSPVVSGDLWFRGQSSAHHQLIPRALRNIEPLTDPYGRAVKRGQIITAGGATFTGPNPERMLATFKRQARPFLHSTPANDFEWMFIAQHHGVPTRLLDWSTNALVALFFAASGAAAKDLNANEACKAFLDGDDTRDDGFAVFAIDPGAINQVSSDRREPIDVAASAAEWSAYLDPVASELASYAPICVCAPHISPRIRAQSGVFTLHGSNLWPLDYYDVFRPLIVKIFVRFMATDLVRRSLAKLGMNHSFIYPGLEGIARDVADAESCRFQIEREHELSKIVDENDSPEMPPNRRKKKGA